MNRNKERIEILYGVHSVCEALKAGRRSFHALCLMRDDARKRFNFILELAEIRNIPVEYGASDIFGRLGSQVHQGIAAKVGRYPLADISDIAKKGATTGRPAFILVLDHIVDPQNMGALTRTALAAGVDGMLIPNARAALPSPLVSHVSAGGMEHMDIACVPNIVSALKGLKKQGIWVVGAILLSPVSLYSIDLTIDVALVLGSEEKGINRLVQQESDFLASIPQAAKAGSLNAAAAGAIALYEVVRQRSNYSGG
ncbi:MAG: 23S rRNA (guanosine(2251)-2'-O)-methyltransferase RlmB [Pseudomonadota bacterium]